MSMKCPRCEGKKVLIGIFPVYADEVPLEKRKPFIEFPCDLCDANGEVDDKFPVRERAGQSLRNIRMRHEITLREFSKRFDIDICALSDAERGKDVPEEVRRKIVRAIDNLEGIS